MKHYPLTLAVISVLPAHLVKSGAAAQQPSGNHDYDFVIKNGKVIEGSGSSWFEAMSDFHVCWQRLSSMGPGTQF